MQITWSGPRSQYSNHQSPTTQLTISPITTRPRPQDHTHLTMVDQGVTRPIYRRAAVVIGCIGIKRTQQLPAQTQEHNTCTGQMVFITHKSAMVCIQCTSRMSSIILLLLCIIINNCVLTVKKVTKLKNSFIEVMM